MDAIRKLLTQINAYWSGKSRAFQRNVIIVAVAAVAVIAILSAVLTHVDYAPLYTNLSTAESGEILQTLNGMGEVARVSGSNVEVPAANVDRLRAVLAAQGYPKNAKNLDIISQAQGIMLTDKDKQPFLVAQRESDLQNAIKEFDGVKDAIVNLVIPEDSLTVLDSNRTDARASIKLTLEDGVELSNSQVKAIAQFVQRSVANLSLDNISIVDNNMNVLDWTDAEQASTTKEHLNLQDSVQLRLQNQVQALLEPLLGVGHVTSQVHVTLDFEDRTTEKQTFEPPVPGSTEGIPVAAERISESIKNGTGTDATQQPGTQTNTGTSTYPTVTLDNGTYKKTQENINYELNSIKETIIAEKGTIKDLSVSVILDSTDQQVDLSSDVKELVTTSIGVSPDNVTVKSLPMAGAAATQALAQEAQAQAAAVLGAQQMRYYIAIGAIVLLILVAMALIFRNRAMARKADLARSEALARTAAREAGYNVEDGEALDGEAPTIPIIGDSEVKTQIGKFIETNPELVTNLLRSWLADEE